MNKASIKIETDAGDFIVTLPDAVFLPKTTTPTPTPPASTNKHHILLNCINWASLAVLPKEATEYTYFVLPVSSAGVLTGGSDTQERKFVSDVHAMGKLATFSIAGGSQNVADITKAITTNRSVLLTNIGNRINTYGYDGVTVDIENTNISSSVIVSFIKDLRKRLDSIKPNLVLGVYTQPYQLNTVWANIGEASNDITWLSAMIYDYPNTVEQLKADTLKWTSKLDKSKLLVGVAVNYDETGLNLTEFPQVVDWLKAQGFKGLGIWEHTIYTQPYRDIVASRLLL